MSRTRVKTEEDDPLTSLNRFVWLVIGATVFAFVIFTLLYLAGLMSLLTFLTLELIVVLSGIGMILVLNRLRKLMEGGR
jgi:hypothetical protein